MSINISQLHTLVDIVDETGLETLYNVMIRFIPEDEPTPDEVAAIAAAREAFARGDFVSTVEP